MQISIVSPDRLQLVAVTCPQCKREISLVGVKFCPFCGGTLIAPRTERRKGIVVFADIAGFTALSETVDPDELRDLIDRVMKRFVAVVDKHGGVVDKIIGDCIMYVFGTEHSFADDHIRTIETVEEIESELRDFNQENKMNLSLHFGISFGTVSVGTVGTARTVMGDTVNLAQRLESSAGLNEVIVSPPFAELFGPGYRFEKLAPVKLKGKKAPIAPFRYCGKIHTKEEETPFVGRLKELKNISTRLEQLAENKTGGSLLIVSPAGIGKTRLLSEVRKPLRKNRITSYTLYFEEGGTSFHLPFKTLLETVLSDAQWKNDKALSMHRLMLAEEKIWETVDFKQFENLVLKVFHHVTSKGPFLLIAENLHRADRSSLLLLTKLRQSSSEEPFYLLATSRKHLDGFEARLELPPLNEADAESLFARLVQPDKLQRQRPEAVLKRCAGNPLFISELARGVNASLPHEKLFSGNMELILAAILDALPPDVRELVKQASIFGSQTPSKYFAMLADRSEEELIQKLTTLQIFDFVPAKDIFVFRHDLLRESAYERINLQARRNWHQAVGEILLDTDAYPEEIAYHFLRSDRKREALRTCLAAGKRLSRLPQQEDALHYLNHAEELAHELADFRALLSALEVRFEVESSGMDVKEALRRLDDWEEDSLPAGHLWAVGRFALLRAKFLFDRHLYEEAFRAYRQAEPGLDAEKEMEGQLLKLRLLNRLRKRKDVTRGGLKYLQRRKLDPSHKGDLYLLLGSVSYFDKELVPAKDFYQKALKAYKKINDQRGLQRTLVNLGNVAHARSNYLSARDHFLECSQLAIQLGDLFGYADSLDRLGRTNFDLLQFGEALANYNQALDMLGKGESENLFHHIHLAIASALRYLGDLSNAESHLKPATQYFRKTDDLYSLGKALRTSALIDRERNHPREALRTLKEASPFLEKYPTQEQLARLLKAQLLIHLGEEGQAKKEISDFGQQFRFESQSQAVQATYLRLDSQLSGRNNPVKRRSIEAYLAKTVKQPLQTHRLPLLVEALEYSPQPNTEKEAVTIRNRLRNAFPEEYRDNFDRKSYVQRLSDLIR